MQRILSMLTTKSREETKPVITDPQNTKGHTALHAAVGHNNVPGVKYLLAKPDTKIFQADDDKYTPLHRAVQNEDEDIAALLIEKASPAELDLRDKYDQSALHIAAFYMLEDTVLAMLKKGANAALTNKLGNTPLHRVFEPNTPTLSSKIVELFLNAPNDASNVANQLNEIPLFCALGNKRIQRLAPQTLSKLMTASELNTKNSKGANLFHIAAANKNMTVAIFSELLDLFRKWFPSQTNILDQVDANGETPLSLAAANGNTALVDFLKEQKATFSGPAGELAVKKALLNNHPKTLIQLITHGANPDVHVYPDSYKSDKSKVYLFSSADGRDSTKCLQPGDTPLHFAVKTENKALAAVCLEKLPQMVNSVNAKMKSPAFTAVQVLSTEMAQLLWNACTVWNAHNETKITITQEFSCGNGRKVTLEHEMQRRGFVDDKDLNDFFSNPQHKLSTEQEKIRKQNQNCKYAKYLTLGMIKKKVGFEGVKEDKEFESGSKFDARLIV